MNLKDIQELIKFVAKSGATEVDLEIDNVKISIKSPPKKKRGKEEDVTEIIQQVVTSPVTPAPIAPVAVNTEPPKKEKPNTQNKEEEKHITIKASMIGTFYRSSSPETPPFVNVGDIISKGDPICIIEAMKLFNEIDAEISGKIVKVLVDDNTPVEFDQPLFLIDPS